MHVLVLTDRFTPEIAASSFRIMEQAQYWLRNNHQVTVVTCVPNFPRGKVFKGYQNKWYQEELIDGVNVIRVASYLAENKGFVKRICDHLSFAVSSILFCYKYPKFDIILATSPPLFTAFAGRCIAFLRRRPWIFDVRDLWPASITAVGISDNVFIRIAEKLERYLYKTADHITTTTKSQKQAIVDKGISTNKISIVYNGADVTGLDKPVAPHIVRSKLGIKNDEFFTGYIGTIGMAHGLEVLIEAANICQQHSDIKFLIMGEGAERQLLEEKAQQLKLTNIIFHDFVPKSEVACYMSALDLPIIHLRSHPVFNGVIPSKLFELMLYSKPVLMAVEGESADIVRESDAGICIKPDDPAAMANVIIEQSKNQKNLYAMGVRGQQLVKEKYTREKSAEASLRIFSKMIKE